MVEVCGVARVAAIVPVFPTISRAYHHNGVVIDYGRTTTATYGGRLLYHAVSRFSMLIFLVRTRVMLCPFVLYR